MSKTEACIVMSVMTAQKYRGARVLIACTLPRLDYIVQRVFEYGCYPEVVKSGVMILAEPPQGGMYPGLDRS